MDGVLFLLSLFFVVRFIFVGEEILVYSVGGDKLVKVREVLLGLVGKSRIV